MQSPERYLAIRRVTLVGAIVNILLAIGKIVFGWVSHSQALIADGFHSIADLATDFLVIVTAKHSSLDADQDHPYGHGRFEAVSTVGLSLVLIAVAIGICVDAGQRVLNPGELEMPTWVAVPAAIVSILAKELLYRYTLEVSRQVNSPLLRANAWHHRSDAVSSIVVLVGVLGAMAGFKFLDAFAAVAVALMIAKIGWEQGWNALQELVDRGLEPERLHQLEYVIADVEGVRDLHTLRTRRMGGEVLVDVHVQVDPYLSVSEGHQIGEFVRRELLRSFQDVADVTVHIDPEDDESHERCAGLPLRRQTLRLLNDRWRALLSGAATQSIHLHYLNGAIEVDLVLPLSLADSPRAANQLIERLQAAVSDVHELGAIRVYFH